MTSQRSLHLVGATGVARTETFDGREHLVVPVVCLIGDNVIHAVNAPEAEGVPASVLSSQGWDGRPLVLGHPAEKGKQISANDPRVIERQGFGFMAATHVKDKRLGTEAWMDVAKLEKLGQHKMLADARAGKPIEVSVGAFVQTRKNAGAFNGKSYATEWATMAPDHLAFLPDSTGACSVEMGCGANRHAMRVCADRLELDVEKSIIDPETLKCLRDIPQSERDKMKSDDFAGPDETYPIKTQADVDAAKHLVGKAANPDAVKSKVIAIAKRKGLTIPAAWQSKAAQMYRKLSEFMKTLDDGADNLGDDSEDEDDDPDEKAETISYEAMATLIEQAEASLAVGKAHAASLVAENGPGDDEGVEDAHLEALIAMCMQVYGTTNGIIKLASNCLRPDGSTSSMSYMATAAGARHNKADQAIIQDTHDKMVQLGADCSEMKAAELKAACRCEEDSMTKSEKIAALLALKDANYTDDQKKGIELLPEAVVAHLHTLAAKSPADALIQAKYNADTAVAAHGHAMNTMDEADKAKKAAAAKAKADKDANDGKDTDADEDDDSKDVKAAKAHRRTLKAAEAAGLSVEDYEEQQWLKTAPKRFRDMAANDKAAKAEKKADLVAALKGGPLTDKQLEAKSLDELETLAAFAGVKNNEVADYSGRGFPVARGAQENDTFANPPNGYALAIEARRKSN